MAEESESESPSGGAADGDSSDPADEATTESDSREAGGTADDAADPAIDPETDTVYSPEDAPEAGGSIDDFLDDDSVAATDATAPEGATGRDDPFDIDERRSVSDAIGAPAPDEELADDPDLELAADVADDDAPDDAPRTDRETGADAAPQEWTREAASESVVEPDDESVVQTGDDPWEESEAVAADSATETPPSQPAPSPPVEESDDLDDDLDDGLVGASPASDEEMPLAAHIEEMVQRLAVVLVVGGVVALAVFPVADRIINYLWNAHIPGAATNPNLRPRLYGPLELLITELKVSALAGFVVGLPIAVYETYLFMRPGLFPRERRYYLAAVPTSLVLALIGVGFAHFVVLPAIFLYFTEYTEESVELIAFGLKETFGLILVLMGYMAIVFQIPLFIMLAIMMNLTTREWMESRRLLFWGGFLGLSFLVSPDPTGMAPIIVAATMITLFEGTLALLRWTGN
ncbi:twin-arginine translocase subunit TatC [Haloplanus halophilus]|uniref:twin-arginine translocase subunit TatC n=1 Tax=Haloplanus halophilus TaxID=2949993 RepID=UPI00203E86F9|nr:twin-arginine translocase subunit TatC [Haloplanus sp. GDY1]